MSFYLTDMGASPSPVDDLLEKLENQPILNSADGFPPPKISALRLFLDEEDVLRECRADNVKLINFLCRPEILMDLVRTTFELPAIIGALRPDSSGLQKSATSTETPQPVAEREQQKEHHMKRALIASELLTSDNKKLGETIVNDDKIMDCIFEYLNVESGQLYSAVAANFAKLIVSLLKTHHVQVIKQMSKKGQLLIEHLVRHIDSAAIADLIVKILDGPESNDFNNNSNFSNIAPHSIYHSNPNFHAQCQAVRKPTQQALDLLANADIFRRLAQTFVKASTDHQQAILDEEDSIQASTVTTATIVAISTTIQPTQSDTMSKDKNQLVTEAIESTETKRSELEGSDPSTDALLGKHPLDACGSAERPSQKPRSEEEEENAVMKDTSVDIKDETASSKSVTAATDGPDKSPKAGSDQESSSMVTDKSEADTNADMKESSSDEQVKARGTDNDAKETDRVKEELSEQEIAEANARRRRLREETMVNVSATMFGLTERMLQLPDLGCEIPDKLSVYATPIVISRLIDAGIYARCNGTIELPKLPGSDIMDGVNATVDDSPKDAKLEIDEKAAHTHRVESFTSGGSTALMHALQLSAKLVTTESNIYRDEGSLEGGLLVGAMGMGMNTHPFNQIQSTTLDSAALMKKVINASAGGIGQAGAGGATGSSANRNDSNSPNKGKNNGEDGGKQYGDRIVPIEGLESELEQRFERLAQMLDDGDGNEAESGMPERDTLERGRLPLGSLRLMLAEFFASCINQTSQKTVNRITELGVPKTLLMLFDRYRWSSMLHGVITTAIIDCLIGGHARRSGRLAWFEAGLIPWMMEVWRRNSIEEGEMGAPSGGRCGYLGHLIRIGTALKSLLDDHKDDSTSSPTAGDGGASEESEATESTTVKKKPGVIIDEGNPSGLPRAEEAEQFMEFAEVMLMPALRREAKPLCDENGVDGVNGMGGSESGGGPGGGEEVEEATDIVVMGGIQFVEGLPGNARVEDEEGEIQPVDTAFDDLEHFGPDDDGGVESITRVEVDHDIPVEMRDQVLKISGEKSVSGSSSNGGINSSSSSSSSKHSSGGHSDHSSSAGSSRLDKGRKDSSSSSRRSGDREENKDSSSEDEGSYIEFVDDRKTSSTTSRKRSSSSSSRNKKDSSCGRNSNYDTGKLASEMGRMNMGDGKDEAPSASLDGVVIEIDDENDVIEEDTIASASSRAGGNKVNANLVGSAAATPSSAELDLADEEASSDEDYETWEDAHKSLLANKAAKTAAAAAAAAASGPDNHILTPSSSSSSSTS